MIKKIILIFLLTVTTCFAFELTHFDMRKNFQMVNKENNPCDEIPGRWDGTMISKWGGGEVHAQGVKLSGKNFELRSLDSTRYDALKGSCDDGVITMQNIEAKGTVFNNTMVLIGEGFITLRKKSL